MRLPVDGARHPVDHREPRDGVNELGRGLAFEQEHDGSEFARVVEVSTQRDKEVVYAFAGEVGSQYDAPIVPVVLARVLVRTMLARRHQLQTARGFFALQQVAESRRHTYIRCA